MFVSLLISKYPCNLINHILLIRIMFLPVSDKTFHLFTPVGLILVIGINTS